MTNAYPWVPFYEALADKLLEYRNKRNEFFELIKKVSSEQPLMKYFHFEREDWWGQRNHQIDPFSVIGIINRNISAANRTTLAKVLSDNFNIQHPAPTQFNGIPVMDNRKFFLKGRRKFGICLFSPWKVQKQRFSQTNLKEHSSRQFR